MFLLIFESLGTSELLLIGVLALIFLGPRKMPEYARKLGKLMNDFRSTTNEFKATWEREVNFDEETKAFRDDDEVPVPVPRITAADPAVFPPDSIAVAEQNNVIKETTGDDDINDRKNWL